MTFQLVSNSWHLQRRPVSIFFSQKQFDKAILVWQQLDSSFFPHSGRKGRKKKNPNWKAPKVMPSVSRIVVKLESSSWSNCTLFFAPGFWRLPLAHESAISPQLFLVLLAKDVNWIGAHEAFFPGGCCRWCCKNVLAVFFYSRNSNQCFSVHEKNQVMFF